MGVLLYRLLGSVGYYFTVVFRETVSNLLFRHHFSTLSGMKQRFLFVLETQYRSYIPQIEFLQPTKTTTCIYNNRNN